MITVLPVWEGSAAIRPQKKETCLLLFLPGHTCAEPDINVDKEKNLTEDGGGKMIQY